MNRYQGLTILTGSNGTQYYRDVKYPDIPNDPGDVYIITDRTDRLDLIANDYYNDITLYWIISTANDIPRDTLYVSAGTQLRIPGNVTNILQDFNTLNGLS